MSKINKQYILGVYQGHNSTICLIDGGEIIFALSEERLTRRKNDGSFPRNAIEFGFNYLGIDRKDIKTVVFNSVPLESTVIGVDGGFGGLLNKNEIIKYVLGERVHLKLKDKAVKFYWKNFLKENSKQVFDLFDKGHTEFYFPDHHLLHTYSGLYFSDFPQKEEDCLIFTCDGEGHGLSATVNLFKKGKLERLSAIHYSSSLGHFYEAVTECLGMKKMEHEYKVMGLSPYSEDAPEVGELLDIFRTMYYFPDRDFKSKVHSAIYPWFIKNRIKGYRFDYIASAAQKLIEEILTRWIENYVKDYQIRNIVLSGGVFMNVKANMKIAQLPFISKMYVMPSCSDESIALGAAIYGSVNNGISVKKADNLYFGMEYSQKYIDGFISKIDMEKYSVQKTENIEEEIAYLLSEKHIVAHFAGRMEWGARALGNRSIFANASEPSLVHKLNKMIKNRDFWMPFAPVVLEEDADRYIAKPDWRKVNTSTMMCAFETTQLAQKHLYCAMHPYDKTVRVQIVSPNINQKLYNILQSYKKQTGMGGFLNTSFNLHGYPIVCSPEDAFYVFKDTGLDILAIGQYLIRKKTS